ncbi:hypothetical protein MMC07_000757 [Pseudocyphellaria aurata]|nr:hypothetical protein [Pseudocyphellaria aurata]
MVSFCLGVRYYRHWSKPKPTRFKDRFRCENILGCGKSNGIGNISIQDAVKSRALPNQRLVQAFGIDNAFTTFDCDYRMEFRKEAKEKLNLAVGKWKDLTFFAKELLGKSLETEASKKVVFLIPLLQSLTLKISMNILFKLDPFTLDDKAISNLVCQINKLWLESKLVPLNTMLLENLKKELEENLGKIFPGKRIDTKETPIDSKEKPMNLILPAYETMWRIVFRCFLEVAFRNPSATSKWRTVLLRYLENPTAEQFKHTSVEDPVSVSFIVSEALRLYPPTKRVFRKFPEDSGWGDRTVAADIEACQRDSDIWGPRSLEFVPSRWIDLSAEIRGSFMPFGGRLFICPAKEGFGPRMIGLLVAVLAQQIWKDKWILNHDEDWDPLAPLDSSRTAYHSLSISRRSGA